MKKCIVFTAMAAMVAVMLAANEKPVRHGPPNRKFKPSGGIVEKQMVSKVFRICDTTGMEPAEKVDELVRGIRYSVLLPIEIVRVGKPEGCPFEAAENLVAQSNVGSGMLIVEDAKLPIFLTAADRKWTILNIASLKADSPTPEKLLERFTKVCWAGVAHALGAGYSSHPGCLMVPFTNVYELDAIKVLKPGPEPYNTMLQTGNAFGMKTLSIASYRMACQQGWAPAPTNDVQKAIWDEVHKLPTEPIKIKPETKKVEK